MKIEIYLDSLFFMNLMINWGILKLLQYKFSLGKEKIRIFTASALGASAYLLLLLPPIKGVWWQFAVMGISVLLMVHIALPKRKRRYVGRMTCWGFAYSFIIAGILRAVFYRWQLLNGRESTLFGVIAGVYICVRVGMWCIREEKYSIKRSICTVSVESAGVQTTVKALIDTGNSLIEPVSKQPVCLLEEELLAQITLENPLFLRVIPFRSVGCERGVLYGVQIPKLMITYEEEVYAVTDVICAGVEHRLSKNHAYQMILHPDLITKENCILSSNH